jgi:chromosome segregation ATPase
MGKVSEIVRTVSDLGWTSAPKLAPDEPIAPSTARPGTPRPAKDGPTTFAEIGARIGADNEVLRNLLVDTGHQLNAIDDLKASFNRLTEPLHNVLTTLENERAEHAGSKGQLVALRHSHEALRADFQKLDARATELKADNERLNKSLSAALQKTSELESNRSELRTALGTARDAITTMTKQIEEHTARIRALSDEKDALIERTDAGDRKMSVVESELAQARERISLLENDKTSLQTSLDKTLGESSRLSRQLGETESALAQARNRIQQLDAALASTETERDKLIAFLDEANERRQSEVYALELKLDGMRSRCDTAEQMLASARQTVIGRSEALRAAEARAFEANVARKEAEAKADHLTAVTDSRGEQIERLESEVLELNERVRLLMASQTATESLLQDAQEHVVSLTAHVEHLQSEATAERTKSEEDLVQLSSNLEHERAARITAEAALDRARVDYGRLQQQSAHHQRHFAKSNRDAAE